MRAAGHGLTDEERDDLASFPFAGGEAPSELASLLLAERGPAGEPLLAAIRHYSEHFLPSRGWARVLVLGCGGAAGAMLLVERGYDVTLTDADPQALRFARHRLERRGLDAQFVFTDRARPVPAGEFDAIVCSARSGLAARRKGLAALRAALRRGGRLLIEDPLRMDAPRATPVSGPGRRLLPL